MRIIHDEFKIRCKKCSINLAISIDDLKIDEYGYFVTCILCKQNFTLQSNEIPENIKNVFNKINYPDY